MDYGAITSDTSIFDQKGLKLESGILKMLEQFNGKLSHIISTISAVCFMVYLDIDLNMD
jgi:prenyltransferase beta subunit